MKNGIVIAFEHFNPPTRFHIEFVQRVIKESKNYDYDYVIYNRKKSAPLDFLRSTYWTNKILGEGVVKSYSSDNLLHVLEDIKSKYKNVVLVGTDQTIVECYSILNEFADTFSNFSFIEQEIFQPNIREILTEAYTSNDYMYVDEVLVENLQEKDKQLFITEMIDGYNLYEATPDGELSTSDVLGGAWKYTKQGLSSVSSMATDLYHLGGKFFEFVGHIIDFGFNKQPVVGGIVVLYLIAKKYSKKKNVPFNPNPTTPDARKAWNLIKSDRELEYEAYVNAKSRIAIDSAIDELEERHISPKNYIKAIDHASEEDLNLVSHKKAIRSEALEESLSVKDVDHAVHKISKYQGISFEDKAKLINALVAMRTQQYKEAEKTLSGVSDVAKMEIIANLRPSMDIEDLNTIFSKKVSPWRNATDNFVGRVNSEIGRRIIPVGLGAAAGYYASGIAGVDPEMGAAIGGVTGYLAKGLGFKAYNKYKDLTEPKSDYERLIDRVERLERKSNDR